MSFRVVGLSPDPFLHLYGMSERSLASNGVQRIIATEGSQLPDRVELRDAAPGETLLLINYTHQPAETPFRSSHAIFVREGATTPVEVVNGVPAALRTRLLSLRAFDRNHMMVDADVVEGAHAGSLIDSLFAQSPVAYIHAHYARRGCFAGLIERT